MGIRIVCNFLTLSFVLSFFVFSKTENLIQKAHLIFNEDSKYNHKVVLGDTILFYMKSEVFEYIKSTSTPILSINKNNARMLNAYDLDTFLEKAFVVRKNINSKNDNRIRILKKDMYFDTIYLYENRKCKSYRYIVKWKNEEVD